MFESASDSTMPLLLVNLLFALLALGVGFVSGAFFLGIRGRADALRQLEGQLGNESRLALERALLASSRLHDLANGMASDVGEHSQRVEQITADLKGDRSTDARGRKSAIAQAVTKIVDANERLQERLAHAEEQIRVQAKEIALHESEARTDSLTNLPNRRAFDDEIKRRYSEWRRYGTPFTLMLLDVDEFKRFNDRHGHQAGDDALRAVADALVDSTREMDLPCRYGGEEFAVVLPATRAPAASVVAERVRQTIADRRVEIGDQTFSVTASFGVAQIADADDAERVLKRADDALYRSKDAGRNCGHFHDGAAFVPIGDVAEGESAETVAEEPDAGPPADPPAADALEGLPNRTIFAEHLRRRVAEAHRTNEPLSVMGVHVRAYQRLKEQCGESAACAAINSVARFLEGVLREMDTLARPDEDRFVVMLPGAEEATAQAIAARASAALAKCSLPVSDERLALDVATGVTGARPDDTAATMLNRLETALSGAPSSADPLLV